MVVIRKIVFTNVPDRNFMIMCILFRKSTFTIINNLHKEYAPFDIYLYMDISVVMIYLRWINLCIVQVLNCTHQFFLLPLSCFCLAELQNTSI